MSCSEIRRLCIRKMKCQIPTLVHLQEVSYAKVLDGNTLIDLLIIAMAKKQVSQLLTVVKQVNLLFGMQLQIPVWKI